jgi:23S rRNA (adenine2030-N6)-methyltransferase
VNYRHAFHAGNFADCMKHALLVALLRALQRKPGPLFVLDTHSGAGHYDLNDARSLRTNEAASGIVRLLEENPAPLPDGTTVLDPGPAPPHGGIQPEPSWPGPTRPSVAARVGPDSRVRPGHDELRGIATPVHCRPSHLAGPEVTTSEAPTADPLADYLALVRTLGLYPGSPELIRSLLRHDDRLACCELHPEEFASLRRLFRRDNQVAVHHRDGWEALKALLPPAQKRGLVLIDPPYESQFEFAHLAQGLALARTRFATGVLAAWYPIKHRARERAFFHALTLRDVIACEFLLREPTDPARLNGCGLLVVNPPYRFELQAQQILDKLLDRLGYREPGESATVMRLADE